MKTLMVTGTDTNVGKTWVTCVLLRQLRQQGVSVGAYKPVCSGAVRGDDGVFHWDDIDQLSTAIGGQHPVDVICPQRFLSAVAPNFAAVLDGRRVDDALLSVGLQNWDGLADFVIVEGAGGLMCPLSDSTTVADLAVRLGSPVLIVAANRLGVINHTLLTVDGAIRRGLRVAGVVLNDCQPVCGTDDASTDSNAQQLAHWLNNIPLYRCAWGKTHIEPVGDHSEFLLVNAFR
ncbi:MAG: dethiobiotin synthase [Planctomycetaceae bacterium]